MELRKFKEKNPKKVGIILFTITCILLISGVILYRTFAIFQVDTTQNMIEGNIQDEGDIRFMVYVDDVLQKDVPSKESGYSLDTSTSYCENGDLISWNDEKWSVELKNISTTKTKCYLKFKQIYKEEILNGAIPDLMNGRLVPVKISDTEKPSDVTSYSNTDNNYGGKVTKADITSEWYSYSKQQWANAVILKDGKVDDYQPGDEILESDIESYFVWIPRYRYQLKDDESIYDEYSDINQKFGEKLNNNDIPNKGINNPYEIVFETKEKGLSTGTQQKEYLTHPAFVSFDVNGMWVGKFETGTTLTSNYNITNSSSVQIKPNIYSWREIQVVNAFYTSYEYLRDLESHMMKNMEWGAIFYLTYSKYGTCKEEKCSEPRINNNGYYVTGYSANFEPTCGYTATNENCNKYESVELNKDGSLGWNYYNPNSQIASTTGNYTGIYDMSGSAWEVVMGVMQGGNNNPNPASGPNATHHSGFNGPYSNCTDNGGKENCDGTTQNITGKEWPPSIYYDLYSYDIVHTTYQRGHLGDATKELGPFYSINYNYGTYKTTGYISNYFADFAYFVYAGNPWFVWGGSFSYGSESGVGAFGVWTGDTNAAYTFRIVLAP